MKTIYRLKSWLHHKLMSLGLPICCGANQPCFRKGKRRRQNTAYSDDERNWVTACDDCMVIIQERWDDMWDDYYGGLL